MKLKDIVNEKNDVRKYMSIDIPDEVRYELENWDYDVDTVLQVARIYVDADKFDEEVIPLKLDDNQQIVLEWLKKDKKYRPFRSIGFLDYSDGIIHDLPPKEVYKAYRQLDYVQQFEVLAAFAQWGLEQEEAE